MRFKTIFSWRDCAVRARESGFDGMSPVGASIYCSPHPAALQIAPAARLRGFCLCDSAHGEFLYKGDCNLFQLSAFQKNKWKDNKKIKICGFGCCPHETGNFN